MTNEDRQHLASRATALAKLAVLRRVDLWAEELGRVNGHDLTIFHNVGRLPLRPLFGVMVGGVMRPLTCGAAGRAALPIVRRLQTFNRPRLPVVLTFFTMLKDQGFFAWLAEPTLGDDGPTLVLHDRPACQPISRCLILEAVERILEWHEADPSPHP